MSPAIAAARSRRAPRLLGHLLEQVAQHTPRADTLREREPQRGAVELQFEPFGVATDAAPFPVGSAEELGGVAGLGQNVLRLEVDDAAETGDQMRGLERHPVESEVGKAREHFRLRLAIEI